MNILSINSRWHPRSVLSHYFPGNRLQKLKQNDLISNQNTFKSNTSASMINQLNISMLSRLALTAQLQDMETEAEQISRKTEQELNRNLHKQPDIDNIRNHRELTENPKDLFSKVADDFSRLFSKAGFAVNEVRNFVSQIIKALKDKISSGVEQLNISFSSSESLSLNTAYL